MSRSVSAQSSRLFAERARVPFVGALMAVGAAVSPAAAQYSIAAPSGYEVEFERDRLLAMRDRSEALWEDLQQDPAILYFTAYGRELTVENPRNAYPWNAIEVVADSLASVVTPGNLREADRAYYNYVVLRMHAVQEDPDVSCDVVFDRELEAVGGFVDGWVIARTIYAGPAFEPLDEFAVAREDGVLAGMLADRGDRQLGGCLAVWREENPDAVEAYREWRRTTYLAESG